MVEFQSVILGMMMVINLLQRLLTKNGR